MERTEVIFIGVLLGCLHGFILAGFLNAFATASFILYGDIYTIPFAATAVIDVLLLAGILSYTIWINWVMDALVWLENVLREEDELE